MNILRFSYQIFLTSLFFITSGINAQGSSYVPEEGLRNTIRTAQWQALKPKTPKKQRFLTGLVFGSNQCFQVYEKAAKQRNWPPYELPTIFAFYTIVLEETINGESYTEEVITQMYTDMVAKYNAVSGTKPSSEKSLQHVGDSLLIKAIWVGTVFELSKKRSVEIQQIAKQLLDDFSLQQLVVLPKSKKEEVPAVASRTPKKTTPKQTIPKKTTPIKTQPLPNSSQVAGVTDVIMRTVTSYGLNGVYVNNEVSVLFDNGTIFTNPNKPLDELNTAQSQRQKPKKWGEWKKNGSVLRVTKPWKNKSYDWKTWFKVRPGKSGQKISGRFNSLDGFGGATVVNASMVAFDTQGRFAWKTVKGGNTVWKPVYSKSSSSGTYKIGDYKITLMYNNGVRESFFFGFYPKDNQHFVIGSSHFAPKN